MNDDSLTDLLPSGRYLVLCGRRDDAHAWQEFLGPDRCLAIPLDARDAAPSSPLRGATSHLAWQHRLVAALDQPGPMTRQADAFDANREAVLILPDPLDPPLTGTRQVFGRRPALNRLLGNKTVIDSVWDLMGLPRTRSIVADSPTDLVRLGALVNDGAGVVCAVQPPDETPTAGADGILWWRDDDARHFSCVAPGMRVKLMPFLPGLPVRLHGMVTVTGTVVFPPLEVVTLVRPGQGTFLCAGVADSLGDVTDLAALTERAGAALRRVFGYRGAFSIDGILTAQGFRPTDLNPRLTSAMEAAPSALRVRLHLANALAREGVDLDVATVRRLADAAFAGRPDHTLYGAATTAHGARRHAAVRWQGGRLALSHDGAADGRLAITPSPRGWLLTATLSRDKLVGRHDLADTAAQVFGLSDNAFGTDFGELLPPNRLVENPQVPRQRIPAVETISGQCRASDGNRSGVELSAAMVRRCERCGQPEAQTESGCWMPVETALRDRESAAVQVHGGSSA